MSVVIEDTSGRHARVVLSDDAVVRLGLHPGDDIDEARAGAVGAAAAEVRGIDLAMAALARRARSRRELGLLLARRGIPRDVASATCDRLAASGLIDDAQFAREFVRSRVGGAGASVWLLRRDLGRKGVARETADAAIAEEFRESGVGEPDVAHRIARKKWRTLESVARADRAKAMRRLMSFLQRRGFSGDVVRAVVRDVTA